MRIVQGATNFRNDHGVLPFRTSMAEPTEENNYQVSLVTADGKDADMLAILTNNETVDDEERMNTTRDTYFPADEQEKKMEMRMQAVDIANDVAKKQLKIVQDIASLLGETAADTLIAIERLKETISDE
jgi:hypothetical protein